MGIAPPQNTVPTLAPVVVSKNDASLALPTVQGVWTDLDPGGTAAARPLDVVIPNVAAGQWISLYASMHPSNVAQSVQMDVFTVVAGSPVHQFGQSVGGTSTWLLPASTTAAVSGTRSYQLQSDDIENGSVRLRMRARNTGTTARNVLAVSGFEFRMEGRGPFV